MTRMFLTRHGASEWHEEDRYAGSSDIELSPAGHRQAEALASWAKAAQLDAIVASPMLRCRQTARPAEAAVELPALIDDRLRELDFGVAEGLTKAELQQRHPGAWTAFEVDPVANHLPGGERPREAADRLRAALDDLSREFEDCRVLLVSHSTAMRLLLCDLLRIPLERYRSVFPKLASCALSEIDLSHGRASLLTLNQQVQPGTTGANT